MEGPGTYADNLDTGLLVMNSYRKQCADFEARRTALAAAENLFDLPISVCIIPGLSTTNRLGLLHSPKARKVFQRLAYQCYLTLSLIHI